MPDVIRRDVEVHLVVKAVEAQTELQRTLRVSEMHGPLGTVLTESSAIISAVTPESSKAASLMRLKAWMRRTNAQTIDCGLYVDVSTLVDRYFQSLPPFAATGDKKNEFPDAVALLALRA
jgi:hypothetical protein